MACSTGRDTFCWRFRPPVGAVPLPRAAGRVRNGAHAVGAREGNMGGAIARA